MKIINVRLFHKIVRPEVYIIVSESDDLALHSRFHNCLKLDKCLTCTIIAVSQTVFKAMAFKLGMTVDLCMAYMLFSYQWSWPWCKVTGGRQRQKNQHWIISTTKQVISIKFATTVGHFVCDLDFENVCMAWIPCFISWKLSVHLSQL